MDAYRLYFTNPDGRRLTAFEFTSADDEQAERVAEQFGCERGAELWCGGREVSRWSLDAAVVGRT